MNIYSVFGFLLAAAVLFAGLFLSSKTMIIFFNFHGALIVFGGTLAATALSYQLNHIFKLVKISLGRVFLGKKVSFQNTVSEILRAGEAIKNGESIEQVSTLVKDPFLKEALALIGDNLLDAQEIGEVLDDRLNVMHDHYTSETSKVKNIAKFPPAFGLMGTSIGMIVILANLQGKDAIKMIGPAMGICLTATFYGIAFANFVILPLAENLSTSNFEVYLKNQIIVEGIKLIQNKTNPVVMAEKLNSFLTPANRLDWKTVLGK